MHTVAGADGCVPSVDIRTADRRGVTIEWCQSIKDILCLVIAYRNDIGENVLEMCYTD